MKNHRKRPSFPAIASTLALVIALGGLVTGTAFSGGGSKVPGKNGVKSSDIAANAVGTSDIANNGVKDADVEQLAMPALSLAGSQCQATGPGSYYPLQGGIDAQGIVHLQGGVASCTGSTLVILPPALRPTLTLELPSFSGGSPGFAGSVVIAPTGVVTNSSGTNAGIHHLDGITYKP
jgi:hypothetical protein